MLVMESFGSDHLPKLDFFLDFRALCVGIMEPPITKVRQHSHIKADATSVMNKSFQKLLSNNFQVIIFERMAKNYFKVNT